VGKSNKQQQRDCPLPITSLPTTRQSPFLFYPFSDFDPEKSFSENSSLPAGSCQLEARHLAARADQPLVGEVAAQPLVGEVAAHLPI